MEISRSEYWHAPVDGADRRAPRWRARPLARAVDSCTNHARPRDSSVQDRPGTKPNQTPWSHGGSTRSRALEPLVAGDPGIEPGVAVLETTVLPIHQSPFAAGIVGAPPGTDGRPTRRRATPTCPNAAKARAAVGRNHS